MIDPFKKFVIGTKTSDVVAERLGVLHYVIKS